MLILNMKVGEGVVLNGVICISVSAVEKGRVKIAVKAPPDISIVRQELLTRLSQVQAGAQENKASLASGS